jgi:ATP-binding cassette subfamily C protein CydD
MGKGLMKYPGVRVVMMALGVLTLMQTLAIILQAKWLAEVISALFAGSPLQEQYGLSLLFLLVFGVRHLLWMLQQKIAYTFAEATAAGERRKLLERLFKLGPQYAKRTGTGSLVTLALEGVTQFRVYLELFLPRMTSMGITPWLILLYVFIIDWRAGAVLAVTMPILVIFLILVGMAARTYTNNQLASYRTLSNHFVDSLRGLETLKVLGRSKAHTASIARVSERYRTSTMKTLRLAFLSSFALDFFTMLSVAVVAVNLGLRLIDGKMGLATALTVLILAPEYFLPVRMVGSDFHATQNGKEAGETIAAVLSEPEAGEAGASGAEARTKTAPGVRPDALEVNPQGTPEVTQQETLELIAPSPLVSDTTSGPLLQVSGLTVRHEEAGEASLDGVSFELKGYLKVGVIGESGAGKSTLIDVLSGFLAPTAGGLSWNGQPVALSSEQWRSRITYIPQQPYLFNVSLSDNIRFYQPEATDGQVAQAIAAAGLAEFTASLPDGAATVLGSGGGRSLSGGQEQRVALARSFLSEHPLLLLDEPTAHLDIETEYELKATMLPLFAGKLVFLATHRLHWMVDMDVVLVLDGGRLVEMGSHEELLALRGVYYQLAMAHGEAF